MTEKESTSAKLDQLVAEQQESPSHALARLIADNRGLPDVPKLSELIDRSAEARAKAVARDRLDGVGRRFVALRNDARSLHERLLRIESDGAVMPNLRDQFAIAALQGIVAARGCGDRSDHAYSARVAYSYADAMLAARQPRESGPTDAMARAMEPETE